MPQDYKLSLKRRSTLIPLWLLIAALLAMGAQVVTATIPSGLITQRSLSNSGVASSWLEIGSSLVEGSQQVVVLGDTTNASMVSATRSVSGVLPLLFLCISLAMFAIAMTNESLSLGIVVGAFIFVVLIMFGVQAIQAALLSLWGW